MGTHRVAEYEYEVQCGNQSFGEIDADQHEDGQRHRLCAAPSTPSHLRQKKGSTRLLIVTSQHQECHLRCWGNIHVVQHTATITINVNADVHHQQHQHHHCSSWSSSSSLSPSSPLPTSIVNHSLYVSIIPGSITVRVIAQRKDTPP